MLQCRAERSPILRNYETARAEIIVDRENRAAYVIHNDIAPSPTSNPPFD